MSIPFSAGTSQALEAAEVEATITVESEHILLGILTQPDTDAAYLLTEHFGITLEGVRDALQALRPVTPPADELELSADAQRIVEKAVSEARTLGADEIDPLHLLLGLLRRRHEVSGVALTILEGYVEDVDTITREVRATLRERNV